MVFAGDADIVFSYVGFRRMIGAQSGEVHA